MNGLLPYEHGGNIYQAGRSVKLTDLIDFSANINPLGLSVAVREALHLAIEQVIHYPDAEAFELKKAISNYYGVGENKIIPGNGAVEILYLLAHVLKPRRVLIPAPSFGEYERAARAVQAEVQYYVLSPEQNFVFDIQQLLGLLDSSVDMVFLGNPNNPTGTLLKSTEIEILLEKAKRIGTQVVVDESFMDFLTDDSQFSCRHLLERYDNLVIIHSLTKFYAIPGLRLGFALASAELAARLHMAKDPWNVNSLAQIAGVVALGDKQYQLDSRKAIAQLKEEFYRLLRDTPGCRPFYPAVNYILLNIKDTGYTSSELRSALLSENGILIRDCSNYPGLSDRYIRLAVKTSELNTRLIDSLRQVVARE